MMTELSRRLFVALLLPPMPPARQIEIETIARLLNEARVDVIEERKFDAAA